MESLFSPLDTRYQKHLPATLSEQQSLQSQIEVEKQWLLALMEEGLLEKKSDDELNAALAGLSFEEIEEIEKTTQHATRALVEAIANRLSDSGMEEAAKWVHVGLTSFDTVDTAQRHRVKVFFEKDYFSQLEELKIQLRRLANDYKDTKQVGRTHGQWAVPTLFGLQFAEAHERLDKLESNLDKDLSELTGQASGAIGGYHASSLMTNDPIGLEKKFLDRLGLKPHYSSIQILPQEDLLTLANTCFCMSSVVAKVANDLRHLARSEIFEVVEGMGKGQVGSSTMPQKRNPWNLEHVCSLYKILQSRYNLLQIDAVTEHQRDLTNSASSRFYIEFFSFHYLMLKRLTKVLNNLQVNTQAIAKNLADAGSSVYAEAYYILGTTKGWDDAHHKVRECSREAEASGKDLSEVLVAQKLLAAEEVEPSALQQRILSGSRAKFAAIAETWPKE